MPRHEADVGRLIDARQFDHAQVRERLDLMDERSLVRAFGQPEHHIRYAEAIRWRPGMGRPPLASDDPAVVQGMGRCAAGRVRRRLPSPVFSDVLHPAECAWCDYPLAELVLACDWATWHSRHVIAEWLTWRQAEGSPVTYDRSVGVVPRYDEPPSAAFWAAPQEDREARIAAARASS